MRRNCTRCVSFLHNHLSSGTSRTMHDFTRFVLSAIVLASIGFTSMAQTTTVTPNAAIPDPGCLMQDIVVTNVDQLMDVDLGFGLEQICIDITHARIGQLKVSVITPNGKEVLLVDRRGGLGDHFTNTCFDGVSATNISAGSAPFTGSFLPEEPLGDINDGSENSAGTWVLKVCDEIFGTAGTLVSASLTFGPNPAQVPSSPNDDCMDALTVPVNSSYLCSQTIEGNILGATSSGTTTCSFPAGAMFDDDIWFEFTPSTPRQEVVISNIVGTTTDLIYEVLSGSCASLTSIYCHNDPDDFFQLDGLTTSTTYYLRVATLTSSPDQDVTFDLCIKEGIPDPPANDECNQAIALTLSGPTCSFTQGTIAGADSSLNADGCQEDGGFNDDVWFKFDATESSHEIVIENISGSSNLLDYQIFRGSCANPQDEQCPIDEVPGSSFNILLTGLSSDTYFIRIASFLPSPHNTTFDICVKSSTTPPPTNDDCTGALTLSTDCNNPTAGTLVSATASSPPTNCNFNGSQSFDDDVWFVLANVSTSAYQIDISNVTGSSDDFVFEIFTSATDCNSLTFIRCHDDPNDALILSNLIHGNDYYIRVASWENTGQTTTFDICATTPPATPSNDECANATDLMIVDTSCNFSSANFVGATPSAQSENCGGNPFYNDIWFSFEANAPKEVLELANITNRPQEIIGVLGSGPCGSFTPFDCFTFESSDETSYILEGLTGGQTYYLRLATYDFTTLATTLDICIHDTIPDPPANDECGNAVLLTVTDYDNCDHKIAGTLLGGTASNVSTGCAGSIGDFDDDVWYKFVATQVSQVVEVSNIAGSTEDLSFEVLDDCTNPTSIWCHRSTAGTFTKFRPGLFTIGNTYYIRVASFDPGIQTTTFDLCVRDSVPDPPTNDVCTSATMLTATGDGICNSIMGTMNGATTDLGSPFCGGTNNRDVWYQFTAAATSHLINVSSINGGVLTGVQAFSGTCGALSELACKTDFNNGDLLVESLNVGVTYYVRVLEDFSNPVTFDICVKGAPSGCNLTVTTMAASGAGSLREAIDCSSSGDTIRFDAAVHNSTISLAVPQIVIPHPLVLFSDISDQVTLGNADMNNTEVLISIQSDLEVAGLILDGQTDASLILKIEPGGGLDLTDAEVVKATIDN